MDLGTTQAITLVYGLILLLFAFMHQQVRLQLMCGIGTIFYAWTIYTMEWYTQHESHFYTYYDFNLRNYALLLGVMFLLWVRWFSFAIILATTLALFIVPLFGVYAILPYHTYLWLMMHGAFVLSLSVLPWRYERLRLKPSPIAPLLVRWFNWRHLPGFGVTLR